MWDDITMYRQRLYTVSSFRVPQFYLASSYNHNNTTYLQGAHFKHYSIKIYLAHVPLQKIVWVRGWVLTQYECVGGRVDVDPVWMCGPLMCRWDCGFGGGLFSLRNKMIDSNIGKMVWYLNYTNSITLKTKHSHILSCTKELSIPFLLLGLLIIFKMYLNENKTSI